MTINRSICSCLVNTCFMIYITLFICNFNCIVEANSQFSSDLPPPPAKPERFTSKQQLKDYLVKLHEYYAIIGRPRFGRSYTITDDNEQQQQTQQNSLKIKKIVDPSFLIISSSGNNKNAREQEQQQQIDDHTKLTGNNYLYSLLVNGYNNKPNVHQQHFYDNDGSLVVPASVYIDDAKISNDSGEPFGL